MYTDEKKTDYYELEIPRIENIDIYRQNTAQANEKPDYSYCFSYVYGSAERNCILFSRVYTGSNEYKILQPWYYVKTLSPYIEYEILSKSEFDNLIYNPHNYLKQQHNLEYVETICLEDKLNKNCVQSAICDITINSEIPNLSV